MTYRSIAVHSEVAAVRLWWTRARPWWDTERRAGDAQGTAALVMCRAHSALISHTGNAYTGRETLAGILYEKTVLRNETATDCKAWWQQNANPRSPVVPLKPPQVPGHARARWCHSGPRPGQNCHVYPCCTLPPLCRGLWQTGCPFNETTTY